VLVALPPNATKLFPRLPLEKIAQRAKAEGLPSLNAVTINNHLNNLSALFRWAIKEEHLDRNPAMGLRVAEPVAKRDRRRPFTLAELQAIFAGKLYRPGAPRTGDAWVMLVSLFAGLRLNEACQLATKDAEIIDGVPVLRVRLGDDGKTRLKSSAATRTVPIHSALVKAGLLDHWRKMIKQGERQLFADLRPAATGYYSDAASKRLNRYIRGLGISDRRAAVHSLRHNWRDALREAGVSAERVRALGGWTSKSAGEEEHTYGGGFTAKALAVEIERITYPGLDLSLLTSG
jgi:integrase